MQRESALITFFALLLFIVGIGIPAFWNVTIGGNLIIGYGLLVGPMYMQTNDDQVLSEIKKTLQNENPIKMLTCSDGDENPVLTGHYGGNCSLFYAEIACIAFSIFGGFVTLIIGCFNTRPATIPSLLTTATMAATILIYTQNTPYKSLTSTSVTSSICTLFAALPGACKPTAWYIGGPLAIAGAGLQLIATMGFVCAQARARKNGDLP